MDVSIATVMFHLLCKNLLVCYGRRYTIRASLTCNSLLFNKCISTTANQHSFTVSYLINSFGFSQKSALLASKYLQFESPERPDSIIALLKSHGFSETQISKAIRCTPRLLGASIEKTILPKLEYFYSSGFSITELPQILSVCPIVLLRSLENHIVPIFDYLSDLSKSREMTVAVIKRSPYLLLYDIDTCLVPKLNLLRDIGVSGSNIHMLLCYWSRIFGANSDTFRNTVEEVKDLGISPLSSHFVLAIVAKGFGRTKWENKVNVFKRCGWSEEEVLAAFCKNPLFMTASKDKLMAVMDFLVNEMNMESSAIAKCPGLFVLSMKKTFIPRATVFQFLLSKGLIDRKDTNLITLFTYSEKDFLRKFVNSYDEAPQLLKLYQEKLDHLKMKKTYVSKERDGVIVK
ncbi:hypothetical protein Ddye_017268 [Dipteronia dyeriana]|uniref:Uncharacterized protein n=1 Tax=Dipteronia dyeriana TaxID=168575 RepID=A0AAD9U8V3_9ROSI|nr:hypothetical protein Ddye_017268 [Dipteronia dyeriana]